MLSSILAQFEYTSVVKQYCVDGIPFDKHLHVPEIHKLTGEVFCQREDEGHLFKVNYMHILICFYLNSAFNFRELLLASDKDVLTVYAWRDLWRLCKTLTHILHSLH